MSYFQYYAIDHFSKHESTLKRENEFLLSTMINQKKIHCTNYRKYHVQMEQRAFGK